MPKHAALLGYLGLIPFFAIPVAVLMDILSYPQAFAFFTQYSAIILSFFGGIHWYVAITDPKFSHQLYVAMLPSIVAWLALILFADARTLGVLSLAYVAVLIYDKFTLQMAPAQIIEYTRMRVILTTLVVTSHVVMVGLS
ncbi:DUF3429 domain-containing protein [Alteromonas sp. ASW11-36]|uniref:DUF3429 domain-containing protein n=1 Tax=Alteromonas arenosi TaxID=3055817 RepID=A0ABT7SWW3_9ALTE|nr:DUF3429 domain-containing protein [Alteromonas sp. ASW11-36]MDM7860679.1 DUF3429 domain-containing protein [Alteromonas sp. ASW11-36]